MVIRINNKQRINKQMKTYYLLMIDSFKFVVHKQSSNLQVTQQNEGGITNIVAIFRSLDNCKYWEKMEDFHETIGEVIFKNRFFTDQGSYQNEINNFLNNN